MRVLVLGAGVVGTTTAWYAAASGHDVTVVDRREGAGLETSFANGGQIAVSHAEPWANPDAPAKLLKWIWRDDAPLLFRLKADPAQWRWGAQFLYECMAWRTRENTAQIVKMSIYSGKALGELREETGIEYHCNTRGILHYFTEHDAFERGIEAAKIMNAYGLEIEAKTRDEAVALEPALAHARNRIAGATYSRTDESGDAHVFTQRLAALAEARGVKFRYKSEVRGIRMGSEGVKGVVVASAGGEETLTADAYVVALGSYSPLLLRPLGIRMPVYPVKGYSITVPISDASGAPESTVMDETHKVAVTRLGDRIRVGGTAELAGYTLKLHEARRRTLEHVVTDLFPRGGDVARAEFWCGLRPMTPDGTPLVGPTSIANLFVATGHGTLGWTMAAGTARVIAALISGRSPQIDLSGLTLERYAAARR